MKDSTLNSVRQRPMVSVIAITLLILGLVFVLGATADEGGPIPTEGGSGPWMNADDGSSCPNGLVCAEWPSASKGTITTCCIPPEYLDTYIGVDTSSCPVVLTIRAL